MSGIRGIFGKDLTLRDVLKFSKNFSVLINSKKCVIATDTRPTGQMIAETVKAGLMQSGVDVYDLGMAPTPVVFRESRKYGAGIIVTSSHNPIEWNGLKMIIDGRGINEKQLDVVMSEQNPPKSEIGEEYKIESTYVDDASKIIGKLSDIPKVMVDIGGGAARGFSSQLLEKVGCNVFTINEEREKSSRGPDPTADALKDLVENTKDLDIGFAFDLDGDRLVIVINGEKKNPDVTVGIGVIKALELGCKNFVLSQDTSISVEKYIKQNGGTVFRSKVGETNVIEKMTETKSRVGGEGSSGGFILSDFNYCRDGILTSGLIASIIKKDKFANALNFMEKYHIIRDKVGYDSEHHDNILKVLHDKMKEKFGTVETLDGLKTIIDEDSWALVRKSNTENVIRVSAESNSLEKVRNIHQEIKDLIKESYEQIK